MNYDEPEDLDGITITHGYIKDKKEFVFIGQFYQNNDAWTDSLTYIIFYDGNKDESSQWIVHKLKYLTDANGVIGAWCEKPEPMWVFGYVNTGYIEKFDPNGQKLRNEKMPGRPLGEIELKPSFNGVTGVTGGHIYTAEIFREVWKRESEGNWKLLHNGIPDFDYYGKHEELGSVHGFRNIAGFSDNDLYACGGEGDLWRYDGSIWKQLDLPTNDDLVHICCGDDGLVYITTRDTIILGRNDHWKIIKQDLTSDTFESIAWYQNKCLINTQYALYEIADGKFSKSSLNENMPNPASIMATRDNILLISTRFSGVQNEISYHDGTEWHKVLHRERSPKKPGEKSLLELMIELEDKQ